MHINLDKVEGASVAKDPRTGRSNSLKLRDERAIDKLQRELDAAREALRDD